MDYIIGLDGGGTTTRALLADSKGSVYADTVAGPSNLNAVSETVVQETLKQVFSDLKKQAPQLFFKATIVFCGIAGSSTVYNSSKLHEVLKEISPSFASIFLEIDALNALYSGTLGNPGIVQIAGTGTISYGIDQEKNQLRLGGWGHLLGDEGSGYSIGRQAITLALKVYDGRENPDILSENVFEFFCTKTGEKLINKVYAAESPRELIASASKCVFAAYQQKDINATIIIKRACQEISNNIIAIYRKLWQDESEIKVVLCGGVFNDSSVMPPIIQENLNQQMNLLKILLPELPPVGGSIIGGILTKEKQINEQTVFNLTKNLMKNRKV